METGSSLNNYLCFIGLTIYKTHSGVVLFEGAEGGKLVDKLTEGKPADWGWVDSESSDSEPEILMPPTVVKRPRKMLAQRSIARRPAVLRA